MTQISSQASGESNVGIAATDPAVIMNPREFEALESQLQSAIAEANNTHASFQLRCAALGNLTRDAFPQLIAHSKQLAVGIPDDVRKPLVARGIMLECRLMDAERLQADPAITADEFKTVAWTSLGLCHARDLVQLCKELKAAVLVL